MTTMTLRQFIAPVLVDGGWEFDAAGDPTAAWKRHGVNRVSPVTGRAQIDVVAERIHYTVRFHGHPWTVEKIIEELLRLQAEARLIAAAPELLAFAHDIDDEWHLAHDELKRGDRDALVARLSAWQDAARAAIAKAEGREP